MKAKKVLSIILTILLVTSVFSTICLADYTPKQFKDSGSIKSSGTGIDNVKSVGGKIVGLVQVVGTIVAVGMLIVLGIKYMMGSAEERADYKKTLFPYFIGAILIFAAANIAQIIYSWAKNL